MFVYFWIIVAAILIFGIKIILVEVMFVYFWIIVAAILIFGIKKSCAIAEHGVWGFSNAL